MKKYDLKKILDEWSTGGSMVTDDPFPSPDQPDDVEDLTSGDKEGGLTTTIPGPSNPENVPGPDRKKLNMKEADELTPAQPKPEKEPPMVTPDMKMDPSMMGEMPPAGDAGGEMGMDPSMMGMGMPTGPANAFEVGRIYELKKIYSRLVSMQSYLAGTTDVNLIQLRNYVSNTMDLFRTLISNVALYKDNLDEIIVTFYKVVDNVYVILSKYYKDNTNGNDVMVRAIE